MIRPLTEAEFLASRPEAYDGRPVLRISDAARSYGAATGDKLIYRVGDGKDDWIAKEDSNGKELMRWNVHNLHSIVWSPEEDA